jgi:hypothetical protein
LVVTEGALQGFREIKMAPQPLFAEIVADPVPVEPAVAFGAHAPATVASSFWTYPYNWPRAPGDVVVENDFIVTFSNVAANIRTAALAETVVIEAGAGVALLPMVKVPGATSKGPETVSTPENATIAPAAFEFPVQEKV